MARYRLQQFLTQEIPDFLLMDIAYHWQANDNRAMALQAPRTPARIPECGKQAEGDLKLHQVVSGLRAGVDIFMGVFGDWDEQFSAAPC